jgi:hypothetical protein
VLGIQLRTTAAVAFLHQLFAIFYHFFYRTQPHEPARGSIGQHEGRSTSAQFPY